eukprot:m.144849 g.144849  ORF g.144849 m.144849 type:complete len:57 (-) comp16051_c0_seq8:433-603(-)
MAILVPHVMQNISILPQSKAALQDTDSCLCILKSSIESKEHQHISIGDRGKLGPPP